MATAMDHIITNVIINTDFKTAILKSFISDHFTIMLAFRIDDKKIQTNQNIKFTNQCLMKRQ